MRTYANIITLVFTCLGFAMADQSLPTFENTERITFMVVSGWELTIRPNGSAVLSCGSGPMDTAESPEGTFSLQDIYSALVPKLKVASEKGDVAVAIRESGVTTTTPRYINRSEAKPIFAKAQQRSTTLYKERFDALVKAELEDLEHSILSDKYEVPQGSPPLLSEILANEAPRSSPPQRMPSRTVKSPSVIPPPPLEVPEAGLASPHSKETAPSTSWILMVLVLVGACGLLWLVINKRK